MEKSLVNMKKIILYILLLTSLNVSSQTFYGSYYSNGWDLGEIIWPSYHNVTEYELNIQNNFTPNRFWLQMRELPSCGVVIKITGNNNSGGVLAFSGGSSYGSHTNGVGLLTMPLHVGTYRVQHLPIINEIDSPIIDFFWWVEKIDTCDLCSSSLLLPVELNDFDVVYSKEINKTILSWQTFTETNNSGFEIQKSKDGINFHYIGFIDGHDNSNEVLKYEFIDDEKEIGLNYYRLKQIDHDDGFVFSDIKFVNVLQKGKEEKRQIDLIGRNINSNYKGVYFDCINGVCKLKFK